MARETKAERETRLELSRQMTLAAEAAEYPDNLMTLLERAQKANFELEVRERTFFLRDRDDSDELFSLDLNYSQAAQSRLEDVQWRVQFKEDRQAESLRKYNVRQAALAKLTAEERELLNV